MTISAFFAALGALWLVTLSFRVIALRYAQAPEKNPKEFERVFRGQANCAEYMPIFLVLLAIAEWQGVSSTFLISMASLFMLGRVLHGILFCFVRRYNLLWRVFSMMSTFVGIIALAGALLQSVYRVTLG